jgi:Ca-activated chloride channel family protein
MRQFAVLFFLFIALGSYSQEWRDSLKVARDAYKKQEFPKALKYYQSAQKNAPTNIDLSDEMGQSAYKAREFEKAEKIYQQSAASKKDATSKAKSYHNMGNSRMQSKDYNGAIDAYKEALRNNPKDEQTRYNLSEAIRRLKDEQKKNPNQKENDQKNQNQNKNNNQNKSGSQEKQNKQPPSPSQSKRNQDKSGNGNQSKLPNKTVERMLDNLMKAEAATKRKINGNGTGGSTTTSGKDW